MIVRWSMKSGRRPSQAVARLGAALALLLAVWVPVPAAWADRIDVRQDDRNVVEEAFRHQRSDITIEVTGQVERILKDDRDGSRHQRFVLRLSGSLTLLVAHNIDLAPRVPLAVGDEVTVRGEYEWNPKGGVLHWTHHDPQQRRAGGWIQHRGQLYR